MRSVDVLTEKLKHYRTEEVVDEVRAMSSSDLLAHETALLTSIAHLKAQISKYDVVKESGGECDYEWKTRADYTKAMRDVLIQIIQRERIDRRRKAHEYTMLSHCFIDAAKRKLSKEVYADLQAEAKSMLAHKNNQTQG